MTTPPASPMLALAQRWGALAGLAVALTALLAHFGIPAAFLIGPMIAAIALASRGLTLAMPKPVSAVAEAVVGCMIVGFMPADFFRALLERWPVFSLGVLFVLAASSLLGFLLMRLRILPNSTVVWGLSPGGATVMTVLADHHGADAQLVAFMQYTRVLVITLSAAAFAHLRAAGAPVVEAAAPAAPDLWTCLPALAVVALAVGLMRMRRLVGGPIVLALAAAALLKQGFGAPIALPPWLFACAYAAIGARIGLRFTRALLLHALRSLPAVLAATLALIALCAGLGQALVAFCGLDPLTAYLATSPGGADSISIIAAGSPVDRSFVVTMQTLRLFAVLLLGPAAARFVATRSRAP
ncbi:hypothetical protein SAMN06265338_101492 [Rhodoblastus acidophilus]|uniref:AbrB family transcriptional regulator n=1 Tax=Rhodoblastus acidophilus TaxID=1074 RepID=A0A212Q9Z4_RHOAC|nr:AbrB family transcriptional regulator [Rhodoblastus acidophilus]PPQ40081.1 hypothetical protein CKO16_04620 [Rhodoblastus acidophilus]RAI21116.1 hypothetical protein CH337_08325 [Rhodoblastus acidophilus]SNB56074.1 hypothetical protein SAMN06265338_101492 [Rhodoblastus acidophilus]